MVEKLMIRRDKPLTWPLLLIVPEVAFGYFLLGGMLYALGVGEWALLLAGGGFVAMFSFDIIDYD